MLFLQYKVRGNIILASATNRLKEFQEARVWIEKVETDTQHMSVVGLVDASLFDPTAYDLSAMMHRYITAYTSLRDNFKDCMP